MEYTKLQHRDLRMLAWQRASCRARGAAVSLLAHCSDQENGGRIAGAVDWTDTNWMASAAIRWGDVTAALEAGLCFWDGKDLVVRIYDHRGHRELETKRAQGPHGSKGAEFGRLGGRPKKNAHADDPQGVSETPIRGIRDNPPSPAQSSPVQPTPPPASPPSVRAETGDGGDVDPDDRFHPQDIPEPPAAEPLPGPGSRHLTTAIVRRVDAVDPQDVRAAAKVGSLPGLVAAFQANTDPSRRADWRREADGLSTPMLVVLFAQARAAGRSIREPSGLRQARERLETDHIPREEAAALLAAYGLKPPTPAAAAAGGASP